MFLPIRGIELAHFRIELDYIAKKPMWRNGRRNGLKIRWALKGPCRFESGHRHSDSDGCHVLANYRNCGLRIAERQTEIDIGKD